MKRLNLWLGIDRAIFFTILNRGLGGSAGLLTIYFVSHYLSPTLQGFYYTFYSLIALQIFAELGLNFAIVQFASHEMARLSWTQAGTLVGNPDSKRRLQSLMHFAINWYGVAMLIMVVLLLPTGFLFFDSAPHAGAIGPRILIPWSLLVVFTAVNIVSNALTAILEGCGKVSEVAILRMWQSIFSAIVVWIVLSAGGDLYALAANSFVVALVGLSWLWIKFQRFFRELFGQRTQLPGMSWRQEIWPFQWRIAVSSLSGFFISQTFSPILFVTNGPVVAGQMGMTMQIIGAMNGFAMAWITTKVPSYGQLIAKNQIDALNTLFSRGLFQSLGFLLGGFITVLFILLYLTSTGSPYASRVLPTNLFAILGITGIANHIVCAEAAYLRAHKQEPFMVLSVLNGVATASLALLLIPPLGGAGAVYSYATTVLLIGLGGGTLVFIRKRREWGVKRSGSFRQ
jgi:O-antigen/teichoic acid export membrane protein